MCVEKEKGESPALGVGTVPASVLGRGLARGTQALFPSWSTCLDCLILFLTSVFYQYPESSIGPAHALQPAISAIWHRTFHGERELQRAGWMKEIGESAAEGKKSGSLGTSPPPLWLAAPPLLFIRLNRACIATIFRTRARRTHPRRGFSQSTSQPFRPLISARSTDDGRQPK